MGRAVLAAMDILHRPFITWIMRRVPPAKAYLDIGAGSGYASLAILRRRRHSSVTLLDRSSAALSFAEKRLFRYRDRAAFVLGSAEALPFHESSFSAAIMLDSLYYFDADKAFTEAFRVLAAGGTLVIGDEAFDSSAVPAGIRDIVTARGIDEMISALSRCGFLVLSSEHGKASWSCIVAVKPMC